VKTFEIEAIVESIEANRVMITDHADEEAYNDGLSFNDILTAISAGEIIEQYPEDKPYPSCLILSKDVQAEPIHTVWAYNSETKSSVLITVYRPDPKQWIDGRIRRIE
jgi:hypothetical protein